MKKTFTHTKTGKHYIGDKDFVNALLKYCKDEKFTDERMEVTFDRMVETKKLQSTHICSKCSGTGIYAMWYENGQPKSLTGTTCYKCNGYGYIPD